MVRICISKFPYGVLFILIMPLFLIFWASNLNKTINLPVPRLGLFTIGIIAFGIFLMIKGVSYLSLFGKSLPLNIFLPKKFVTRGIYAWFSHPIYLGFVLLSLGLSLYSHSSGGFYIITPVLILGMISLVYGYERFAIFKIFGKSASKYHPIFSISTSSKENKYNKLVISLIILTITAFYLYVLLFLSNFNLASGT